jgi:hypothetical protein
MKLCSILRGMNAARKEAPGSVSLLCFHFNHVPNLVQQASSMERSQLAPSLPVDRHLLKPTAGR